MGGSEGSRMRRKKLKGKAAGRRNIKSFGWISSLCDRCVMYMYVSLSVLVFVCVLGIVLVWVERLLFVK